MDRRPKGNFSCHILYCSVLTNEFTLKPLESNSQKNNDECFNTLRVRVFVYVCMGVFVCVYMSQLYTHFYDCVVHV